MLMPSMIGTDLLDYFFDAPTFKGFDSCNTNKSMMNTDVKESDSGYEVSMNLPGFSRENIQCELKNGYLTVNAVMQSSSDNEADNGKYIRKERYSGSCSRSFYVGEDITETDIKAKFENGVLKLDIPKKDAKPAIEEKHFVAIEG